MKALAMQLQRLLRRKNRTRFHILIYCICLYLIQLENVKNLVWASGWPIMPFACIGSCGVYPPGEVYSACIKKSIFAYIYIYVCVCINYIFPRKVYRDLGYPWTKLTRQGQCNPAVPTRFQDFKRVQLINKMRPFRGPVGK